MHGFRLKGRKWLVHIVAMREALRDPELIDYAFQVIAKAGKVAFTDDSDLQGSECFLCGQRWVEDRAPVMLVLIEPVGKGKGDQGIASAICEECAQLPDIQARSMAILRTSLGMGDFQDVSPGGHA